MLHFLQKLKVTAELGFPSSCIAWGLAGLLSQSISIQVISTLIGASTPHILNAIHRRWKKRRGLTVDVPIRPDHINGLEILTSASVGALSTYLMTQSPRDAVLTALSASSGLLLYRQIPSRADLEIGFGIMNMMGGVILYPLQLVNARVHQPVPRARQIP